jgi:two-component system sensor histidine kinase BaeS
MHGDEVGAELSGSAGRPAAGRAADRSAGSTGWAEVAPWGLAGVLAAVGTLICYDATPGVNWGIWTTLAATGFLWVTSRRARSSREAPADRVAVWCAFMAIVVGWGAAVTTNGFAQFLIIVSCVTLLAVATRVSAGMPGSEVGAGTMASAPFIALGTVTVEAGRRAVSALASARHERRAAVVRGVMLALPVAGLFALVLAGADPLLSVWLGDLWDGLARVIARVAFFLGLGTLALGAYGVAARVASPSRVARPPLARARVGETERRVIVGAVAGVFGAFLALQPTYLFRDMSALRVSGMTYAEYAHRGFTELTIAATLAVALILALDRYTGSEGSRVDAEANRWRHWGTLLLIGEVLIVLASAFHRLTIYETAYGYTLLRLHVQAYEIGVAITLVILAIEVVRPNGRFDAGRAARRTGPVAIAFVLLFSFGNPEAWIVWKNVDQYRVTNKLDTNYLGSLSLDAAPALMQAMSTLPAICAGHLKQDAGVGYERDLKRVEPSHWYEWNYRYERGIAALRAAGVVPPTHSDTLIFGGCYPGMRSITR